LFTPKHTQALGICLSVSFLMEAWRYLLPLISPRLFDARFSLFRINPSQFLPSFRYACLVAEDTGLNLPTSFFAFVFFVLGPFFFFWEIRRLSAEIAICDVPYCLSPSL